MTKKTAKAKAKARTRKTPAKASRSTRKAKTPAGSKAARLRTTAQDAPTGRKGAFLEALGKCGVVKYAADSLKIARRTHYHWLETDPEYAEAAAEAIEIAVERAETELYLRAMGIGRERSNDLLKFYLRHARPAKYRETYPEAPEPVPDRVIRIGEPRSNGRVAEAGDPEGDPPLEASRWG